MGPGGWLNRPIKLSRSTLVPTALALHKQMYSAFAEGDVRTLRDICADGLYESFRARIGNRQRGEKVKWELVRYKGNGRLMSNRAGRLPIEGAAVRQVVVRVRSVQTLTRWRNGKQVEGSGVEKVTTEYVVLQRRLVNWKEQEWQVWGTTQATGLKELEKWKAQKD
jgi:protein MBA1